MSGRFAVSALAAGALLAVLGHHAGAGSASRVSGYVNPLAGQRWELARTDQGVDYKPAVPTPVRAIGDGVVVYSSSTDCPPYGWPGCHVIGYKLEAGPKAGGIVFVAEHLTGLLPAGAVVHAGDRIATAWPGYPWTEWGWANCRGSGPAVSYNGAPDGTRCPAAWRSPGSCASSAPARRRPRGPAPTS
jgi:hypothetical protein